MIISAKSTVICCIRMADSQPKNGTNAALAAPLSVDNENEDEEQNQTQTQTQTQTYHQETESLAPAIVLLISILLFLGGSAWGITHPDEFEALPLLAYSHFIRLCMNAVTYYGELIDWILSHVTDADMFLVQSAVTCCALFWCVRPISHKPRLLIPFFKGSSIERGSHFGNPYPNSSAF